MIEFLNTKPGPKFIKSLWNTLSPLPGGRAAASAIIARVIPYSASISPQIHRLEKGCAEVAMADRRRVRNHLHSIHAIALANLAEFATGLALIYSLPKNSRAILVEFKIQYLKKARGEVTGVANLTLQSILPDKPTHIEVLGVIKDLHGNKVAQATATWLVSPSINP